MTETLARPSRRSFVRAAAWTVPVVSIAAAAPAFATSLTASSNLGSATTPVKWGVGNDKQVSWDLKLVNGPVAIKSITITFMLASNNGSANFNQFEVYGYQPAGGARDGSWTDPTLPVTGTNTVTTSHGTLAAGSTTWLHTNFEGADGSAGNITATYTITYENNTTSGPLKIGPLGWTSGGKHSHPA
jgi:hypothetical protein